jgi:transcriptional regulatory protein RtcR
MDRTKKKTVAIGLLGTTLDAGKGPARWERWRPTISMFQQPDLAIDRFELLYPRVGTSLAKQIAADIAEVSPDTEVRLHSLDPRDPWDFEEVYTALHDFAAGYSFDTERENYLVNITTGTHVAQICLFLLTESRRLPARLVQSSPTRGSKNPAGECRVIDLDLSRYDSIATRFAREHTDNVAGLKSGIRTRNAAFNRLIEELEHVAANSIDPILLMGPTGAGKSQLARRIYELRKHRRVQSERVGAFVEINCATLRGDAAMSALFGHVKGAFTGAASDRPGLLRAADHGLLFLDEIGELGMDEQAMLLRALEEKRFLPLGSDREATSDFQLIAGTNRDLSARVRDGRFRDDLLARINLWTFVLPALKDRREDIEPNIEYELAQFERRSGRTLRFNAEARSNYLAFAVSRAADWTGNFRDLSASITRLGTMATSGRITEAVVEAELARLRHLWSSSRSDTTSASEANASLASQLLADRMAQLDRFDRVQLEDVVAVCRASRSLSDAGRTLFAVSRTAKSSSNDADRLRKYLARFGLDWSSITTFGTDRA